MQPFFISDLIAQRPVVIFSIIVITVALALLTFHIGFLIIGIILFGVIWFIMDSEYHHHQDFKTNFVVFIMFIIIMSISIYKYTIFEPYKEDVSHKYKDIVIYTDKLKQTVYIVYNGVVQDTISVFEPDTLIKNPGNHIKVYKMNHWYNHNIELDWEVDL